MARASVVVMAMAWVAIVPSHARAAGFTVVDDSGRSVRFERPAERVITLAPGLTELLYAAGGGAALVGTTALSD